MEIDFAVVVPMYLCLLFSLCVHEAAHAAMGNYCGDDTARLLGRITLNPLSHIDPIGTVILPLIMLSSGTGMLFGWAKPVPFNPSNLNNRRRDTVLIAVAGPASNLVLAVLFISITRTLSVTGMLDVLPNTFIIFLFYSAIINLVLVMFNLIPVPPLDGHYVLDYFLPPGGQEAMKKIGPFGILIAILLARPLFRFMAPVFEAVQGFMFGA